MNREYINIQIKDKHGKTHTVEISKDIPKEMRERLIREHKKFIRDQK